MFLRTRTFFSVLLVTLFVSVPAVGFAEDNQQKVTIEPRAKPEPAAPASARSNIRIDTTVVQIPVTVTDPLNRFVTGLEKEHFRVFEDKVEQKLRYFASEDAPISVGLIFDTSGSMGSKLDKSRQAVAQFFRTTNPQDEFFLVEFNDRPQLADSPKLTAVQPLRQARKLPTHFYGIPRKRRWNGVAIRAARRSMS